MNFIMSYKLTYCTLANVLYQIGQSSLVKDWRLCAINVLQRNHTFLLFTLNTIYTHIFPGDYVL